MDFTFKTLRHISVAEDRDSCTTQLQVMRVLLRRVALVQIDGLRVCKLSEEAKKS